jgi:hypothetical protein
MSYFTSFNNYQKLLGSYSKAELIYLFSLAKKNFYSVDYYFLLQKKITNDIPFPKRRLNYNLNLINSLDIKIIESMMPSLDIISRKELWVRLRFLESGFKYCYVAKNSKNDIMYMQWLIYPWENEIIRKKYYNHFAELRDFQFLLENAFTFPKFRGFQLYTQVSIDLMNIAKDQNLKACLAYVKSDNITALNELRKLDFTISKRIRERKFLGTTIRNLDR